MDSGLRTTDCELGIKYGLGIKRGLENTSLRIYRWMTHFGYYSRT